MIKRGILLIIIFLVSLGLANAGLQLVLSKDSFSPGEALTGYINYSFSGAKELNTPVKIFGDNTLLWETTLEGFMENIGGDITPPSYEDLGESPIDSKEFLFDEAGSNVSIGFKFEGIINKLQFTSVDFFSLDMSGDKNSGVDPMLPSLDFEDNGVDDWSYIGALTGEYKNLKTDYLFRTSGNQVVGLDKGGKIFCEKIDLKPSFLLPPSTSYDIRVRIKKNVAELGNNNLFGFIKDVNAGGAAPKTPPSCSATSTNCCIIDNPSSTTEFQEKGCGTPIKNFVVDLSKDYFICIYQTTTTQSYYGIEAEDIPGNVQGWFDGKSTKAGMGGLENNYDYFIWGKYGVYVTNLTSANSPIKVNGTSINDKIRTYIRGTCTTEDCIAPIKISSKGPGKIILSNLNLKYYYGGERPINSFVRIKSNPAKITYTDAAKFYLSNVEEGLYAPAEDGEYKLRVVIGSESSEKEFSVVPVPQAVIYYEPWSVTTGIPVSFTADNSVSPTGANFSKIQWSFGDGTNGTGSNVTHVYKKVGDMEVKLIIYDTDGFKGEASETISVKSLEKTLGDNLNLSEEFISVVKSKVASSEEYIKDTAEILGFNPMWDNALNQIILLKEKYTTALNYTAEKKESELITIYNSLMSLMNNVPQSIDVQSFKFPAKAVSINEIPSSTELGINGAKDNFGGAVLAYQEGIDIQGDARAVSLVYLSGKEDNFVLVKKIISSSKALSGRIYEIISIGTIKNITTLNYQAVVPDRVYSWPAESREIVYMLEGSDAESGTSTRTIVIPALKDLQFGSGEDILEAGFDCGNNICNFGEDEVSCPEDCKRHYPWFIITTLLLIGLIGIYYINFYKGPFSSKELGEKIKSLFKNKPKIFKSGEEEKKLINFAKVSRERGLDENQTKFMLKSKGWNDAQINEAIKKSVPPQKKIIKLNK